MREPQPAIGAGLGMTRKNGNRKTQPLDANLPKFDASDHYLDERSLLELPYNGRVVIKNLTYRT